MYISPFFFTVQLYEYSIGFLYSNLQIYTREQQICSNLPD